MSETYKYYAHKECKFYPCHDLENQSCLWCFCPLYYLDSCIGRYTIKNGIKDCSKCLVPHRIENYDQMIKQVVDENNRRLRMLSGKQPTSSTSK